MPFSLMCFQCMKWSLGRGGFCSRQGTKDSRASERFGWRLGDCQCHDEVKDEFEKKVGGRLRLEPGGGGRGLVHGTSEAEPCRRKAEKGLEEEWHCVNHGEVRKRESSNHSPV